MPNVTMLHWAQQKYALVSVSDFGDLITADHKFLSEIVNLETITDMQSWCRI